MNLPWVRLLPWSELLAAPELTIMSDLDGTLVPFFATPAETTAPPELLELLRRLAALPRVHLAVVSGRALADLRRLLPAPGLTLAGQHGCHVDLTGGEERWLVPVDGVAVAVQQVVPAIETTLAGRPGFFLENKGVVLALHYREAQEENVAAVIDAFHRLCRPLLEQLPLEMLKGNKVVELRPRGLHKGRAVCFLASRWPRSLPVYLGDDTTDEDAFRSLPPAGVGILVGHEPRPSAAAYRIPGVEAVWHLLQEILTRRTGSS